jgi:hypothetical protein
MAVNNITMNNVSYQKILDSVNATGLNEIETGSGKYLAAKSFIEQQNSTTGRLILYYDSPAIRGNLESTILKINGKQVISIDELASEINRYSPGTTVTVTVLGQDSELHDRNITLGHNPRDENSSWLGIGFYPKQNQGVLAEFYNQLFSLNRNHIYYASKIGDAGILIYHLFWWLVIISISVALVNMLPMGIFDGGRFFYLTILAITKSENVAKKAFKLATYFFLLVLAVVMFFWFFYMR